MKQWIKSNIRGSVQWSIVILCCYLITQWSGQSRESVRVLKEHTQQQEEWLDILEEKRVNREEEANDYKVAQEELGHIQAIFQSYPQTTYALFRVMELLSAFEEHVKGLEEGQPIEDGVLQTIGIKVIPYRLTTTADKDVIRRVISVLKKAPDIEMVGIKIEKGEDVYDMLLDFYLYIQVEEGKVWEMKEDLPI